MLRFCSQFFRGGYSGAQLRNAELAYGSDARKQVRIVWTHETMINDTMVLRDDKDRIATIADHVVSFSRKFLRATRP